MKYSYPARIATYFLPTFIFCSLLFFTTNFAFGQQNPGGGGQNPGPCAAGTLCNPLKATSIQDFLLSIIDILLTFALPVIIFFIMYGGFKLVTAQGDTSQIEDGKKAITWAVIGGVIVLGAKLIIGVIQGTVTALKNA